MAKAPAKGRFNWWIAAGQSGVPTIWSDRPTVFHREGPHQDVHHFAKQDLTKDAYANLTREWEQASAAYFGLTADTEPSYEPEVSVRHSAGGPVDPERQQREAAALAYVAGYKGTWGLPLDIRADRRFGTKYMKLSDRQIEVLLQGKARDEERAAQQATDPRAEAARQWLIERAPRLQARPGFLADMASRAVAGQGFSPRQLEVVERIMNEDSAKAATTTAASPVPTAPAAEGTYRTPDGDIYRVVLAVHGSGRPYARKLVVVEHGHAEWEMAKGMVFRLRPEWKLTLEQAAEFGRLYGVCAHCAAPLTDPTSIARGIGPICAGKL